MEEKTYNYKDVFWKKKECIYDYFFTSAIV